MNFSDFVIGSCFTRSGGRCECRRDHPDHRGHGRCKARFGRNEGWIACPRTGTQAASVQNCTLLCPACAELTEADWAPLAAVGSEVQV